MEWENINSLFNKHIQDKPTLEEGYAEIRKELEKYNLPSIDIDLKLLKEEFVGWLSYNILSNPIPNSIKSLYFGLCSMQYIDGDNNKVVGTSIHLAGCSKTPKEDEDWACYAKHIPDDRYLYLSGFAEIDKAIVTLKENKSLYEIQVFVGLLNLLINYVVDSQKEIFFEENNLGKLCLGTGYDSGDIFNIGEVEKDQNNSIDND